MQIRILIPFLAAATCLEVALVFAFIYVRISRRPDNLAFSLLSFFLTWMLWTTLCVQECASVESGVFWFRVQFIGIFGSVATLVHFVSLVTGRTLKRNTLVAMYAVALACAIAAFDSHILHAPPRGTPVTKFIDDNELATGPWFNYYTALPITWALAACALMIQGLRRASVPASSPQLLTHHRAGTGRLPELQHADTRQSYSDEAAAFAPLRKQLRIIFLGLILIIIAGILEIGDITDYISIESPINPRGIAATIFCVLTGWTLASEIVRSESHKRDLASENALLDQLAKARVQAIYDAQHQIKNKLASVQWPLRNVLRAMQKGDQSDRQEKRVAVALTEIDELFDVLETMLNLARVEAGQALNLGEKKTVDVGALVHTVFLRRADLRIGETMPLPGIEQSDSHVAILDVKLSRAEYALYPMALRQIVFNLLDNAIKYSPRGSVITVRLWEDAHALRFRITDQGKGLREEDRKRIFNEPFYRGRAEELGIPGTGIGLNLCKRLVEAQGGQIWAESEGEECGSTFFVHLPM